MEGHSIDAPASIVDNVPTAHRQSNSLRLEFFEPAVFWTEAFPVGNGRLGAMVWGGGRSELLQLNEATLWSGGPKDCNNSKAAESLSQVRELVWNGQFVEATDLAKANMLGPDQGQVYQPLGDIKLDFGESHDGLDTDTYRRELDLDTAMVQVAYKTKGVEFRRKIFASYPDRVVAMSIEASESASISCQIAMDSQLPATSSVSSPQRRMVLQGRCPGYVPTSAVTRRSELGRSEKSLESGKMVLRDGEGMAFVAVLQVRLGGSGVGKISSVDDRVLVVEGADVLELLIAASSSFRDAFTDPSSSAKDPLAASMAHLDSLASVPFSTIAAHHLHDYQQLFHRVSLELSSSNNTSTGTATIHSARRTKGDHAVVEHAAVASSCGGAAPPHHHHAAAAAADKLSTKERVKLFQENEDPSLVALLFNFGRYLLIASSRPDSFATNLQGIWSANLHPAWGCTPHTNINLQMNYWPAELCNLSECHQPLFDLIAVLAINGAITAKINYNKGGWVAHHIVDIWGRTAPCSDDPVYALWPMGGAWLCTHLWEHYQFSLDKQFLSDVAFPLMKGCAEFLLDWLVEDPEGNYLVTNPATSPEHEFIAPNGQHASVSYATAMDMAIIREIFSAISATADVLKVTNTDADFVSKVRDANSRLFPPQIGSDGLLMEWALPFKDPEVTHRHMSHLFGLYPGHSISLQTKPKFCEAAVQSIIKRGVTGPGWSTAWKTALWARLWNGDKAYQMVKYLFNLIDDTQTEESLSGGGLYGNLFCAHPPFQIDGNFGIAAAIAEMLIQSDGSNIYLLPALGKKWTDGEVRGLQARGCITINKLKWSQGQMEEVGLEVVSKSPDRESPVLVHYQDATAALHDLQPGTLYSFDGSLAPIHKDLRPQRT